ncbi:MAG TPA: hypothetical protein VKE51_31565 [Vicinamibacterales bacterium]|nr:hypothetical protein [Vicinamibacterales bacterium]
MRWWLLLLATGAWACATLTPEGSRVSVFQAPLNAPPARRRMPSGCQLLFTRPAVSMTELDMEGQKDPFRRQRNQTGAAGGNALLVLSRMTISRHDPECPGASPITDCPPSFGAWFDVVIEAYSCPPDALHTLSTPAER